MILFEGADYTSKIKGYTQLEAYIVSFDFGILPLHTKLATNLLTVSIKCAGM